MLKKKLTALFTLVTLTFLIPQTSSAMEDEEPKMRLKITKCQQCKGDGKVKKTALGCSCWYYNSWTQEYATEDCKTCKPWRNHLKYILEMKEKNLQPEKFEEN